MEKCSSVLLKGELETGYNIEDQHSELSKAEGASLRFLKYALVKLDPESGWGGLRSVQTPQGEHLWLCPEHYETYDPGLPDLPELTRKEREKLECSVEQRKKKNTE